MERYIGVTGFKTVEEVKACEMNSYNRDPIIMYGVLTSRKTLAMPELEGSRRPSLENLSGLLASIPRKGLSTIHHCTDNREFFPEVDKIFSHEDIYNRGLCDALQINQRLPEIKEIEKTKNKYDRLKIILQLEPEDLETPKETGKIVDNYRGLVDYVIIDPSRGAGLGLDKIASLKMLQEIKIDVMPVLAGGLSYRNVFETISFFRESYGDRFCIDAEGKFRDDNDKLMINEMLEYRNRAYSGYDRKLKTAG